MSSGLPVMLPRSASPSSRTARSSSSTGALRAQVVAARQADLARRIVELLAAPRSIAPGLLSQKRAIARIPHAAAAPVVEVADAAGAEAAVGIAAGLVTAALLACCIALAALLTLPPCCAC